MLEPVLGAARNSSLKVLGIGSVRNVHSARSQSMDEQGAIARNLQRTQLRQTYECCHREIQRGVKCPFCGFPPRVGDVRVRLLMMIGLQPRCKKYRVAEWTGQRWKRRRGGFVDHVFG